MAARPYAVDTKVPIVQTRNEIEKLLKDHGASRFFYGDNGNSAVIGFFIRELLVKMTLPLPAEKAGDRKIDSDDAVLEHPHSVPANKIGDRTCDGCVKE